MDALFSFKSSAISVKSTVFSVRNKSLNFEENFQMPRKAPSKKNIKQKPAKKRFKISKLLYIILAIFIVTAFLFLNFYNPKKSKPKYSKPVVTAAAGPSFRKDGNLKIYRKQNEPILLDIEIAENEADRMQGLMYRHHLPENAGMFFIFEQEEIRSFWMKNTFISLDIIYINVDMEIVSIQKYTQPKSVYSLPSEKPARYVLEVNAGFTDKHGISPGDRIDIAD